MPGAADSGFLGTSVEGSEITNATVDTADLADSAVTRVKTSGVIAAVDTNAYPHSTDSADYTLTPTAAAASSEATGATVNKLHNFAAANQASYNGSIYVGKFTGLVPAGTITHVAVKIQSAAGNIRVKVYNDDGAAGDPSTLLGESGSVAASGTGWQYIALTTPATIPASGNVYVGFECDNAALNLYYTSGGASGSIKSVVHAYGAGPNPFGAVTDGTLQQALAITATGQLFEAALSIDGDTATYSKTNSEATPYLKYTLSGSADKEPSGIALWIPAAINTITTLRIWLSADDSTYTKMRTILLSALTAGQYNYIRFVRDIQQNRYLKIDSPDTGVLAVTDILVRPPTESQWNRRQAPIPISTTSTTTDLSGV